MSGVVDDDDLPDGWMRTTIAEVGQLNPPRPDYRPFPDDESIGFIPMAAISEDTGRVTAVERRSLRSVRTKGYRTFTTDDVLFAKITPCMENGKAAVVPGLPNGLGFGSTEFHVLRPSKGVISKYLWYFVRQRGYRKSAEQSMTGSVGQARVPARFIEGSRIPLPPVGEQARIVQALDYATAKAHESIDHITAGRRSIERFRQAVLAAACSGRLTADWRTEHPDLRRSGVEPNAIRQTSSRVGRSKRSRDELDLVGLPEIPETWAYERADRLVAQGTAISYGIILPGPEVRGGVPYVRQQDVMNGTVLVEQLRRTSREIADKHPRSELREGDVLLCIIRNLRVGTVPPGIDRANITQGMVRLRPSDAILGSYLAAYLESAYIQQWMMRRYIGLAMPRINVADARSLPIAVPPVEEQREIVRRTSSMLALADRVVGRFDTAIRQVERSSQAVLAKAFRGELVPTEAELALRDGREYEPASERLAVTSSPTATRPRRPRTTKAPG